MFGARLPSNSQYSLPSSASLTRGAWSFHFAGMWASHIVGGSTTWSSTLTRIMSLACMANLLGSERDRSDTCVNHVTRRGTRVDAGPAPSIRWRDETRGHGGGRRRPVHRAGG